jgi:hypothetical protein
MPLQAGAAKTVITPSESLPMGGYAKYHHILLWPLFPRRSTGVHDDLHARALVLHDGETTLALVALDLMAYYNYDVQAVRQRVRAATGRDDLHIMIAANHIHSGPDTYGVYGGVPQSYRDFTYERCARAVTQALANLRPARAGFAATELSGVGGNIRVPDDPTMIDPEVSVMHVVGTDGQAIATVSNFALHADYLFADNTLISADFAAFFYERLEEAVGGLAIYFNGAQGDVYPFPAINDRRGEKGTRTFAEAEKTGLALADATLAALPGDDALTDDAPIIVKSSPVDIPVSNRLLYVLKWLRIFKHKVKDGRYQSEVWTMRIGQGQFVTMPGQAFHDIGLKLKEQMEGPCKFVIGQGNDEIAYIVPPWRWEKEQGYEEGVSLGPGTWPAIENAIPW